MAKITEIDGIEICMNGNDHNPPHVHFFHPDFAVTILIQSGEVHRGEVRPLRRIKNALKWVLDNQEMLLEMWKNREG